MKLHRRHTGSTRSRLLLSDDYLVHRLESRYLLSAVPVSSDAVSDPLPAIDHLVSPSAAAKPLPQRSPGVTQAMASQAASFVPAATSSAAAAPESLSATAVTSAVPNSGADTLTGSLSGKVLFTSGGHGYVWRPPGFDSNHPNGFWGIMRSYGYNFMEDMGNQDQLTTYADYALHSGATVVPMRPVGHQVNEYVMDNGMGYSASTGGFQIISGSWSGNGVTYPYWSVNNGNDTYHWMFAAASATETAVARYTPNIPVAGFYPVYEWTNPGQDNSSNDRIDDQTFRINYTGGSVEVKVAADKVGNGWVYLGTYYFAQGVSGANVEVSNKTSGPTAGKYVVADGIRFGNGMGDWTEYGAHPVSGYSREDEAAVYWCYDMLGWTGNGTRVSNDEVDNGWNSYADENKNFFASDLYATYMNNKNVGVTTDRLWISFHSNGSGSAGEGGAGRGTLGLINSGPKTPNQPWLAQTAGSTVQQEMVAAGFNWYTVSTPYTTGGYAEISNGTDYINGEFDATIIEVAYHDNATDNALLKNPAVRDAVGRASYHTAVKYFQSFDSLSNTTLFPEPPVNVRTTTDASGNVTISWDAGPSSSGLSGPYGNAATSYRVHTSTNGYGFDGGVVTTGTSLTLTGLSTSSPTYFMITAVNSGGESMNSYVVVAKPQAERHAPVLIVNDFTRMDGVSDEIETKSFGTVYRARARYNNSHDYVVQAASSISAFDSDLGIESATAAAVASGVVNLSDYQAVIWMAGEQSSADVTFTSAAQTAITNYVNAGGRLFVSGANVAYDLSSSGGNHGNSFLSSTLHVTYVRDDTNTHSFSAGVGSSALASVSAGAFEDGTHGTYDVDAPDGISPASGATAALSYSGGTGGTAAVQWAGSNGAKTLFLAFPLESVYNQSTRNAIVAGALSYFGVSSAGAPPISPAPGTPDLADASDMGPLNNDNVTNRNNTAGKTLQFTVPGTVAGALVQLFSDGVLIGQATASGTSTVITTSGTAALSNATHAITAAQTSPGSTVSAASPALTVTIDTVAPTASIAAVNNPRSTPLPSSTVTFSKAVYGLDAADLVLARDGVLVPYTAAQTFTNAGNAYTLNNLSAVTANAGAYTLSLSAASSGVTDLAGNALAADRSISWALNVISGTAGNDTILISRNLSDPTSLSVTINNNPAYSLNLATVGDLTLDAGAGDDAIIVDLSAGQPSFNSGASLTILTGDSTSAGDSVVIRGTAGDDVLNLTSSTFSLNNGPALAYYTGSVTPVSVSFQGSTGNDILNVTDKSVTFPADASLATANLTLNLGAGASANFLATQHLAGLNLSGDAAATLAAGGNRVLVAGSLSLADSSTLDLSDNDLIVTGGGVTPDQFRQMLLAGRVFSSAAVANSLHTTALGYALASDLAVSAFAGQSVSSSALLVKYTYLGDGDLDGQVTADDLARADLGQLMNRSSWVWGDANYDGSVTPADLAMIHAAFRDQGLIL